MKRVSLANKQNISYIGNLGNKVNKQKYLLLMVAPAVLFVLIFNYLTLGGWIIAFKDYQIGLNIWDSKWVGLYNFKSFLLSNADYIYLIRNTLVMNFAMLIVSLGSAMFFAITLNELKSRSFSRIIQTASFFPFFISWVIVYSISSSLLSVSSGALNETMVNWGILKEGLNILGDPKYSWGLAIFVNLWKTLGYNGVIFIAAIASIPPELYEAAEIDGASRWHKIQYITIPGLMTTLVVLLILNSGWILNSNFEMYFLFTNSMNWEKMEVLDMYIYKYGLKLTNYPYAIAVGILKTIVSIFLIFTVNSISKKAMGKGIM